MVHSKYSKKKKNRWQCLQDQDYGVFATFNVSDLSPYVEDTLLDSRSNLFEPGENDGNNHNDVDYYGDMDDHDLPNGMVNHREVNIGSKIYIVSASQVLNFDGLGIFRAIGPCRNYLGVFLINMTFIATQIDFFVLL